MSKRIVGFRASEEYLKRVEQLGSKLGLDFSKTIRLCVDKMLEKYLGTEEEILLVDNEQWNKVVGAKLEGFLRDITQFTKDIKTVSGQAKRGDIMDITKADLEKWIDQAIKEDRSFNAEDPDPEAKKAKKAILITIQRLKGRVE